MSAQTSSGPTSVEGPGLYGLSACFADPEQLVAAAEASYEAGYRRFNTYSPYPIEGAWDAMRHETPMSKVVLLGGILGAIAGFSLATWVSVFAYKLNVGGRPLFSWPAFVPPTFETTILFAGLFAGIGMFLVNKLPMHYHPAFNAPGFERASQDRYFLILEAEDPLFDRVDTESFLSGFEPEEVGEVAH